MSIIPAPEIPISFGVCVGPNFDEQWLDALVHSIKSQDVPEYEIVLIFDRDHNVDPSEDDAVRHAYVSGWLPQKKNHFAKIAKYETLVIVHDYYQFDYDWYDGVKEYIASIGNDWDVLSNLVLRNEDDERGPDWVVNPQYMKKFLDKPENSDILQELTQLYPTENHPMYVVGLNPHEKRLTPIQYVSGGFIMCRRDILRSVQFDETMKYGQSEDLEWFERVKKHTSCRLRFNPFSIVYTQKPNKWRVFQLPRHHVDRLFIAMNEGFFNSASV